MKGILQTSVTNSHETCSPANSSAHLVAPEPGRENLTSVAPNDGIEIAGEEDALATERLALAVNH